MTTTSGPGLLSGPVADDEGRDGELESNKRRKIRKGTRSCWECKRRKIRCVFDMDKATEEDALPCCFGCQRRGTACVSQEFPEEEEQSGGGGRARQMGDRIVRVEALVEQLVRTVSNSSGGGSGGDGGKRGVAARSGSTNSGAGPSSGERGPSLGVPTPDDSGSESARLFGIYSTSVDALEDKGLAPSKFARISHMLHAALPSRQDALALCSLGGGVAVYLKQLLSRPYDHLSTAGWDSPERMAELPGPDAHPVLLAKKLLYLAILLQYSGADFYATLHMSRATAHGGGGLTQLQAMAHMADMAIDNVTTDDELIGGSVDGLECVMLEAMFHGNWGNLRREWMTTRRAMVLAQLMGLHKGHEENHQPLKVLDPTTTNIFPAHLWFRIVSADRRLSMMLGLPQGSLDRGMADEASLANDTTPMGRLERLECVVASRILERNESSGASLADSLAVTHQIDLELQRVAKVVPAKWWLVPAVTSEAIRADPEAMCHATIRLVNQMFHYGMLIHLHLPYMLSFSPAVEYSKVTCVNASRDILTRYISYRSVNHVAFCCRSVDFFALTASMALLLAHLDNHRARSRAARANYSGADFLGHSRLGDRGMMEQVLENMEKVSRASADVVSRKSADVLRRLLEMEGEAAEGTADYTATSDDEGVLKMCIPYFGTIKIAKEGSTLISKEAQQQETSGLDIDGLVHSSNTATKNTTYTVDMAAPELPSQNQHQQQQQQQQQQQLGSNLPQQSTRLVEDTVRQNMTYPGLTADINDWAFQGVDMAFFDSLMRGTTAPGQQAESGHDAVGQQWW